MKRSKKTEKKSNLRLGFYFGFLVLFIIIVSLLFKTFDLIKKSKYDGQNSFTVVVLTNNKAEILTVSPKEGTLKKLEIENAAGTKKLREIGIPYEGIVTAPSGESPDIKSYFRKILFDSNFKERNLTIIDLLKLSWFASSVPTDKIKEVSIKNDGSDLTHDFAYWFADPEILKENINIQVTNSTEVSGLGNKLAKPIVGIGGNVVLVNTSQDLSEKSIIYYKDESYTLRKISKLLEIPVEKKEMNTISDIVIIIGKDKEEY